MWQLCLRTRIKVKKEAGTEKRAKERGPRMAPRPQKSCQFSLTFFPQQLGHYLVPLREKGIGIQQSISSPLGMEQVRELPHAPLPSSKPFQQGAKRRPLHIVLEKGWVVKREGARILAHKSPTPFHIQRHRHTDMQE
jgi:hypothetical protein